LNKSAKIALCSIISALSVVLMIISGIMPLGIYVFPMISGALLSIIAVELGVNWGFVVFFVVSLLSFLLTASKEPFVMFLAFFGHYPLFKLVIERLRKKLLLKWSLKLLIFNFATITTFLIAVNILKLPKASFKIFGVYSPLLLLVFGNFTFLLYDRAISNFIKIYNFHYHDKVKKLLTRGA
jgi:MFS family permease